MTIENTFSKIFWPSPLASIQTHMGVVLECAREVKPLIKALAWDDQAGVNQAKERIFELESKADRLKNNLRAHLPKGLMLPVNRGDILEVLHLQDSIANTAQDIAELLVERKMSIPPFMYDPLIALTSHCIETCEQASRVIGELDELLALGFRGREVEKVNAMLVELNELEHETDDLGMALCKSLFEHEDELKPVSVIMWYRLIEWIGNLADYADKVGNHLLLMIAR